MKRTTLSNVIVLVGFIVFLFPSLLLTSHTASAATGGKGRIFGQLVNGTHNKAPVAGQSVTLQMAQGQSSADLASVKTDARGDFSFANLATDKTITYAVFLRFQGAQYTSELLTLDSKAEQQTTLVVYDATSDASKLAVVESTVLLHEPDVKKGTITVSELYAFKNLDTHTYVGSLQADKGKPNALRFSLPPNVRRVSLDKGFAGYQQILVDRGFAADAAIPPGDSEFGFSFEVPYSAATYDFTYRTVYPTVDLSILVPPALQASSTTLDAQGLVNAEQSSYRLFKATQLRGEHEVQLRLEGLQTTPPPTQPTQISSTTIGLIAIVLLMLAVLLGTWFLLRSRKRRQASAIQSKPSEKKSSTPVKEELTQNIRQQALLRELLELDKAYESGKLKKAVYQERRGKIKARLRTALGEQETLRR